MEAASCLERELKFGAPPGFRLPDLRSLGRGLRVGDVEMRRQVAVYWDTRDLRLMRWGCGLRHRNLDGWAAKLPAEGEGPELVRRELHFAGGPEQPPSDALDLLLGMTRREPLQPLVELHTARERVGVSDEEGRELLEVTNDLVAVVEGQRTVRSFREVEVEFSAGCPADVVAEVQSRLSWAGAGPPHRLAKQVRGLGLEGDVEPEVVAPEVGPDASVGEVLRSALARSVTVLVRHDPGVRLDDDIEDVHEMRVSTRRLRSHLKSFAPLLEPAWTQGLRDELRWLGRELGRVRDADVLGTGLTAVARSVLPAEEQAAKDLLSHLASARAADLELLRTALRSPRYLALVDTLVTAANRPAFAVDPGATAAPLLAPRLKASWKHLRRRVAALSREPLDPELHAVRIRAKHLRYLAEAVTPVFGRRARKLGRAAREVQRVLGDHQDAVVAAAWLRDVAPRVPRDAAFAAGMLAAREAERAAASRDAWRRAWKQLRGARDRLRETLSIHAE